jgi:hypothetical protein
MQTRNVVLSVLLVSTAGCDSSSGAADTGGSGGESVLVDGGGASSSTATAAGGAPSSGGAGGQGDGGGAECSYTATPDAIDYRTADCADPSAPPSEKLTCALVLAAATPTFDPPADPSGYGPTQKQGVVRITFDASSPPFAGENELVFTTVAGSGNTFVGMPSNTRLEIDAGVRLDYGDDSINGQLFEWDGVHDVTITRGDPCHARGRFAVDLKKFVAPDAKARFITLFDVDRFLLEHVHTQAQYSPDVGGPGGGNGSGAPTLLFRAAADSLEPPRHGLYRHHSNQGSASGWGANQIASLEDSSIEDIWTDGGDGLRFETSQGDVGSKRVRATHVFAQNGNLAVAFTPHDASSDDVQISDVHALSMYVGLGAFGTGPGAGVGVFTNTTVDDACVVAGNQAQGPVDPTQSASAAVMNTAAGADVTFTNVFAAGSFSSANPGGTADPSCTAENVYDGFEDWTLELP